MHFVQVSELPQTTMKLLGPVCLGYLWLAVEEKLMCRESCCPEKAAVLSFTVWQLS
jgi:hypothetical protein